MTATERVRGFTGVYDADEHREMAKRLMKPTAARYPGFTRQLTDDQVLDIRQRYATGTVTQAQLALEHGVSQSTIGDLVNGITYRDVRGAS